MTPFAVLRQACGLSQREAANFLGHEKIGSVKQWETARAAGPGVLRELAELARHIEATAARNLTAMREIIAGHDGPIEIGYPADDHEARELGMPCVGAWRAMLSRVLPHFDPARIVLVPRGSTPATAAAADTREG